MSIRNLGPLGAVTLGCAAAVLLPAPALAGTKGADLRVLTHTGKVLAEYTQYTGTVRVKTIDGRDCFRNRSSGRRYRVRGSTPLGVLADARRHDRDLNPLGITDSSFDDFGLGVCRIGNFRTRGFSFWYGSINHVANAAAADRIELGRGDDVVWYLTRGNEEGGFPSELQLRAPARARPGVPFEVRVFRFAPDGGRSPASGVTVTRGLGPTNAQGKTMVSIPTEGRKTLRARGEADDIPSNGVSVCVNSRLAKCPGRHGKLIFGSAKADAIKGTRGWDRIQAGRDGDVVNLRSGGRDRVDCGPGRDKVILERPDRDDRLRRCERVVRR